MSTKSRTNVYLDLTTKQQAIQVLKEYGLGLSDAINIFLKQVVLEKGIPFKPVQPREPNEETKKILEEIRRGENLEEITFEQLKEEAKKCIIN